MSKLYAGVIFYNDGPEILERSLSALKKSKIPIITIDGPFMEFLHLDKTGNQKYYSTDGCIDVAKKYSDLYIPAPPWAWTDQAHKRSTYMQLIPDGDYVLVIDADEFLNVCKIDTERFTEDVYRVKMILSNDRGGGETIRIYKIYPDIKYLYQHCRVYRTRCHNPEYIQSGCVTKAHGGMNYVRPMARDAEGKEIWFTHFNDMRPAERKDQKAEYKRTRQEYQYFDHIMQEKEGK